MTNGNEDMTHALDLLQVELEKGAEIAFQCGYWCLFDINGDGITAGNTIREMLINLAEK